MLPRTFNLRVQPYAWNNVFLRNDLQDTSKCYGWVSIESCTSLVTFFNTVTLRLIFLTNVFQNSHFWLLIEKSINLSSKIKIWRQIIGGRRHSMESLSLRAIILRNLDLQLLRLHHVSLADICALVINTSEKVHVINLEANLRPSQHLKWRFL